MTKLWKSAAYCVFLIVLLFAFYNYKNTNKVEGYFLITQKKIINENYYIFVRSENREVQLNCSKEIYNKAKVSEKNQYRMYYTSNKLTPNEGELLFIKFDDKRSISK